MEVTEMKQYTLELEDATLERAQQEARNVACDDEEDLRLIAWYSRAHETGGPEPACKGEPPKCVRDYAASHDGECRVLVNDGEYEFYFGLTGPDVAELDPDWVAKVHAGAETEERADIQGA